MISSKSRLLDGISLSVLLFGASCYVWAYNGMHTLQHSTHNPAAPIFAGYTRYVRLNQLSWFGIGVILIGIAIGVAAAIHGSCVRVEEAG